MLLRKSFFLITFFTLLFFNCSDDETEMVPVQDLTGFLECNGASFSNGDSSQPSDSVVKIKSKLLSIGSDEIIDHGHIIGKGSIPTFNDFDDKTSLGNKNIISDFTSTFNNLDHSSEYYIVSYLLFDSGFCLHNEPSIVSTIVKQFAEVRILDFTANQNNIVNVSASIDRTFGEEVFDHGFVYTAGTNPPNLSNAFVSFGPVSNVPSHTFPLSLDDLENDRIYTISAYVENCAGYSFSDPVKIHTHDFDFNKFDLPSAIYEDVLNEPFGGDNINNWFEGTTSSGASFEMRNNSYRLQGSQESIAQTTFTNPEDVLKGNDNYQIDLIMDIVDGGESTSGVRFEGGPDGGEYFFGIQNDYTRVGYWSNLDIWNEINGTSTNIASSGDNLLTVRKIYGKFYLYLNEIKVFEFVDSDYDFHSIRVRAGSNTKVDFEDLRIRRIL